MLKQNMITTIVYEGAKTFRLAQTTIPAQNLKYPGKGFLANIVYGVGKLQPRAELEFKQRVEIGNKMLLRLEVSRAKILYVFRIEGMELRGTTQIIKSSVPLSEMFGYATELRSRTQGRGSFTMHFGKYEEVPSALSEEIVNRVQGKVTR